jgi:hypothetical protein
MAIEHGDETVVIVEIDQPFCTRSYGDSLQSPTGGCTAVLGTDGTRKCYNTRFTCQDSANYNPETLTLRFSKSQAGLLQYGNVFPCIENIETTPGKINLGGMDRSAAALGQREVVSITMSDFQHSDFLVDKYRLERASGSASSTGEAFDPYQRGTFWGKWLARNPFFPNYPLRVYEGRGGQALSEMRVRRYIIDRIDGPANGVVKVTAKDIFSRIEKQKALAPKASRGELSADIAAIGVTSFVVTPATFVEEDYPHRPGSPSEVYVSIGEEILKCSRSGATFTVLERGALNTTADAHEQEDLVQLVLSYDSQPAYLIAYDLLVNYTSIGTGAIGSPTVDVINITEWESSASALTELYSSRIARPVPVSELLAELSEQAGFTLYPNVESGKIEFQALRTAASSSTITDDDIVEDSLRIQRKTDKRVSQVWIYYGQIDPTQDLEKPENFFSRLISADLDKQDDTQYGTPSIRTIYSRWIPQFGRSVASSVGERLLAMFKDPPVEVDFALDVSRAEDFQVGDYLNLQTNEIQDDSGDSDSVQHALISVERGDSDLSLTSQSIVFYNPNDDRTIYIENDDFNLNLRDIHDLLFQEPIGGSPTGETVTFIIEPNVVIGSTNTTVPAITTGSWPSGVVLTLINRGTIVGKGGAGGGGGAAHIQTTGTPPSAGSAAGGASGSPGGTALEVQHVITLDNSSGGIYGGGGGGGGGGGAMSANPEPASTNASGGGGGGAGQGLTSTSGGAGGVATRGFGLWLISNGSAGNTSSFASNGAGGSGGVCAGPNVTTTGGTGGAGGTWGNAGASGGNGSNSPDTAPFQQLGSGAAGGAAGKAIEGIAFVSLASPSGSILGAMV